MTVIYLVVGHSRAGVSVLIGRGDGTFLSSPSYSFDGGGFVALADFTGGPNLVAADLDNDGLAELLGVQFSDTTRFLLLKNLAVLRNTCGRGTSLGLDGQTSSASAQHQQDLNPSGDWTTELWFKDDNSAGFNHDYQVLLIKGDREASPESPYFVSVGFKRLVVGVRTAWADYSVGYSLREGDPARWQHVAGVFHAASRSLGVFLDGVLVAQEPLERVSAGNLLPLQIGRSGPLSGKNFNGKIDDVRIWSVARSPGEIRDGYAAELTASSAGLVANWRFNETSGNVAFDLRGTHPAALSGQATFVPDVHP